MTKQLKRSYFSLLVPAVLALALLAGIKSFNLLPHTPTYPSGSLFFLAPFVFVLAVIFAVGLPVFLRSLFAHRMREQSTVAESDWLKFERTLIRISLVTPYLIVPAYLFEFPRFYFSGTTLMALYAVYYFYPSRKRIQFERRMFRVG
ncbi:MAG: hypothetical protein K9M82_11710 [Deltaproteobacteria bacterium]|nr:hypothetical protein [Deltaproteobacteria bacterium]